MGGLQWGTDEGGQPIFGGPPATNPKTNKRSPLQGSVEVVADPVNDQGEFLNVALIPGNIDDRQPVPQLVRKLFVKVFADRGYISKKLSKELMKTFGLQLITKRRKNMKNQLIPQLVVA